MRNGGEECAGLPASHGVVPVEHLFTQLTVLDPAGELDVSELVAQELWPQEALKRHTGWSRSRLTTVESFSQM